MPPRSGLYDDPAIYDILHAPGTTAEVDGLQSIERRFVPRDLTRAQRLWLEPACGSGRYLREAARRGIDTIGFDLSESMIDYARANAPAPAKRVGQSDYFVGDMTDFASRIGRARVSFACNLINTIRHLPSDAAMLDHLGQMARVLAPGAVYVVGLSLTAYGRESPAEDVWTGSRDRTKVTQVVQFIPPRWQGNPQTRSERVLCHLMVATGNGPAEHRDSTYRLRTYNLDQWQALVARSSLRILASIDEDGQDHPAADGGYCLFVLSLESES
jgi:SAM-dependent methyltransferase